MRNTFFVIGAACAISGTGWAFADERATATGSVTDATGKPVEHATVLVYEAHVKKGYSVYCPTCWVDCGKHAVTDTEGNFTIAGLNSDLLFKLLVVKDGYSAVFVDKVDPVTGPAPVASLKPRTPVEDASQVVRGRVVDGRGNPVKDAIVEQAGVTFRGPRGIGRLFGAIDWIDLVAVSNEKGEFEIAYSKPAVEITMNLSPRGMAPKLITEPTGADRKTITVTDGATIRGRLVGPDGKPVANAEVGLSAHSRLSGTTFPEVRIGTREDGTFAITNVPAGRIWLVYPKMASLAERALAGNARPSETKDDGQEVDVGDIQLVSAYTLRGKVVLSDGKPIPPEMRVTLATDWGPDTQMTQLAADGAFEFHGLTKGIYTLGPAVRGYKVVEGFTGEVLLDRQRKDVVIRMEPAPPRQ
jgi:protocatechuate 3,4-dioxygenase beta subunit